MSFRFSLLKKKDTIYASIVEDHYDPVTKKRGTRSIRSFGDISKARAADPEIDGFRRAHEHGLRVYRRSEYRQDERRGQRKVLEERWAKANKLLDQGQGAVSASISHGPRQFIKGGADNTYDANSSPYEKRKIYAGFYALTTSRRDLSSGEVYANLRQSWKIEACFRVMKSDLNERWRTDAAKYTSEYHAKPEWTVAQIASKSTS